MKGFIRNHMFAIPLVSVLAIGVSGSAIVWNATHTEQVAVQAPPAQASTVEWSKTPAAEAIRTTIASIPKEWTRRGEQLVSVTPPFPLSCNLGGMQSAYSVSQQYNNGATVALASYTAGTGALAFKTQHDKSGSCVEPNTAVSNVTESGIGAEAFTIMVRRGTTTSQTTVFRRGDMIGFVLVDGGASAAPAKTVDGLLAAAMGGQCVNEKSTTDDAKRTLWSGEPFTGLLVDTKASIDPWKVPAIPTGATYTQTPIPAKIDQVKTVSLPTVPDYPVWPKLPAEKKAPEMPAAPAADSPSEKTVLNRFPDDKGPGCGWAFTGTVAPPFNANEINASNASIIKAAQDELTKSAGEWSKSVLTYWEAVAAYNKSVDEYEKYRTDVATVTAAWEPINNQWKDYYTKLANHDNAAKAHDDFIARQNDAQKSYDAAVQTCNAPEPTQSPAPSVSPSPSPSPSNSPSSSPTVTPAPTSTNAPAPAPTPSATPVAAGAPGIEMDQMSLVTPMVKAGCPATRPSILDQTAPSVPDAPTKPENPIPVDKR